MPEEVSQIIKETRKGMMANLAGSTWLNVIAMVVKEAIIGTTMEDTIVIWNREAQRLFGYEPEEAIGRSRSLLSASGDRAALRLLRQEIASSRQSASRTLAWECKDGSTRSLMVFLSPVYDSDGRVIGTTEIARAGEAVAQDRTLEQLVHELTEPLTAIGNYLLAGQELLNREAQSDRLKLRTAIQQALRQLTRTINVLHRIRSLAR